MTFRSYLTIYKISRIKNIGNTLKQRYSYSKFWYPWSRYNYVTYPKSKP